MPNRKSVDSATVTSVASAATSAQLIAAKASRNGLIITNTDANALFIKYGTTASATDFTAYIAANTTWVMPEPVYTGRIDGIWAVDGTGVAAITEL